MTLLVESIMFIGSVLLLLSIGLSKMSDRLGVPALLLFLGLGMLAGSEGLGGIHFDNTQAAQILGILALVFILFSGGLDSRWREIKPALTQGLLLSTFGVIFTAGLRPSHLYFCYTSHGYKHYFWVLLCLLQTLQPFFQYYAPKPWRSKGIYGQPWNWNPAAMTPWPIFSPLR